MPPRRRKNSRESRVESRESAQETCETKEPQRGSAVPLSGCEMSDGQSPMPIEKSRGDSRKPKLSKLTTHPGAESGSDAVTCGKPPAFRPNPDPSTSFPPAERLSLSAGGEEILQSARPTERQSLSAKQAAEPQDAADGIERNAEEVLRDTCATERQSLSAKQAAEPQVAAGRVEGNLEKPAPKPRLETLGPALQLLPYQQRWVEDNSPLKVVVKARQIGYSFAASIRALLECLKKKTTWVFLSKGERQSRLLMEKVRNTFSPAEFWLGPASPPFSKVR